MPSFLYYRSDLLFKANAEIFVKTRVFKLVLFALIKYTTMVGTPSLEVVVEVSIL